ncbi:MAG TPA: hypothetical protein VFH51_05390, partial [Myxococcota bacterium]|nr:hypothetical protein [Myxococcota bacterium]
KRVASKDLLFTDVDALPSPDAAGNIAIDPAQMAKNGTFYYDPGSRSIELGPWGCAAVLNPSNKANPTIRFRMRWGVPRLITANIRQSLL